MYTYLGWIITLRLRKDLEFSKSSIFKRKRSEATKTSPQSELEPGSLAQESSDYIHVSYLRVDKCRWKKIDQISSAATNHCTSTAVASARKARTSTRSFRFALFKYKYNIHLAFVNISWYLASDMALGAHCWPRRYLPRLQLGKYVDSVNHAHLGPYGTR